MICYILQVSLILLFLLLLILNFRKKAPKNSKETFYYDTNLKNNPAFLNSSTINEIIYGKYLAKKTDEGYKIKPDNAADLNKTLGFPNRTYGIPGNEIGGGKKTWKQLLEDKLNRQKTEVTNVLEFVPLIWFFQDKLFSEYRKFFNEVECLKYYFNIFKTSRDLPKNAPLEWHEDNCDITLDLNDSISEGDKAYFGLDAIMTKMKMSTWGKNKNE